MLTILKLLEDGKSGINRQQNVLNEKVQGYTFRKEYGTYQARIDINGGRYNKTFQTPEECVDFNNELLSKSFPELAKYYYHIQTTLEIGLGLLETQFWGPMGFNDDDNICDEDFNENVEE